MRVSRVSACRASSVPLPKGTSTAGQAPVTVSSLPPCIPLTFPRTTAGWTAVPTTAIHLGFSQTALLHDIAMRGADSIDLPGCAGPRDGDIIHLLHTSLPGCDSEASLQCFYSSGHASMHSLAVLSNVKSMDCSSCPVKLNANTASLQSFCETDSFVAQTIVL